MFWLEYYCRSASCWRDYLDDFGVEVSWLHFIGAQAEAIKVFQRGFAVRVIDDNGRVVASFGDSLAL